MQMERVFISAGESQKTPIREMLYLAIHWLRLSVPLIQTYISLTLHPMRAITAVSFRGH